MKSSLLLNKTSFITEVPFLLCVCIESIPHQQWGATILSLNHSRKELQLFRELF